jgi:hypothetical protein
MPYDITVDDKIRAFWNGAGMPSPAQCELHPDQYGRYFDEYTKLARYPAATSGTFTQYVDHKVTRVTTGNVLLHATLPHTLSILAGADPVGQGMNVQSVTPLLTPAAGYTYAGLFRFTLINATSMLENQWFVGLSGATTALLAGAGTGEFADVNFIGFGNEDTVTSANMLFQKNDGGATSTSVDTGVALVSGTNVWCGFVVNGVASAKFWVNGAWGPSGVPTIYKTDIPAAVPLFLTYVAQGNGSGATALAIDKVDIRWTHSGAVA